MFKKPSPIVWYDRTSQKFIFDENIFNQIVNSSEEAKKLPVAIVSIAGDCRKGKSFLINFFIRYLQNYKSKDWIGDDNEPLEGFSWMPGTKRDTVGIVMWPMPFVIERQDGKKIAVLLIDLQGFFDDESDHQEAELLFAITAIISSIQIYNQMSNLQSDDVKHLASISRYGEIIGRNEPFKAFQNLLFLVRDWVNEHEHPYGLEGGTTFLKNKRQNQSKEFDREWTTLEKCYSHINCFLMPPPGDNVTRNRKFKGELKLINEDFLDNLKKLVCSLLSPETIPIKKWLGAEIKLSEMIDFFSSWIAEINEKQSANLGKLLLPLEKSIAEGAKNAARAIFMHKMFPFDAAKLSKEALDILFLEAREAAVQDFISRTKNFVNIDAREKLRRNLQDFIEAQRPRSVFEKIIQLIGMENFTRARHPGPYQIINRNLLIKITFVIVIPLIICIYLIAIMIGAVGLIFFC